MITEPKWPEPDHESGDFTDGWNQAIELSKLAFSKWMRDPSGGEENEMATKVTVLNKKEIEAALSLWKVYDLLSALDLASRKKVYARWEQLKIILPVDEKRWEKELKRVSK